MHIHLGEMKPNKNVLPKAMADLQYVITMAIKKLREGGNERKTSHMRRWDLNPSARMSCHWLHVEEDNN